MSDVQSSSGDRDATRARAAQMPRWCDCVPGCSQARTHEPRIQLTDWSTQDVIERRERCFNLEVLRGAVSRLASS